MVIQIIIYLKGYEVDSSNQGPCVGKLVVVYQWTAVYSTEA